MTPEQFLELAQILPESLILVASTGEILSANRHAAAFLCRKSKDLIGKCLTELVIDTPEKVSNYLRTCSQSRQMILGTLTFSQNKEKKLVCRSQGAVIKPKSLESPAIILLRIEKRDANTNKFVVLNHKIHELSREIQQRKRAQQELTQSYETLEQTLSKLRAALDVVQTEKMAGLGQLVAGIAHEINNPISFIYGNLIHAQDYSHDLLELINLYQEEYPNPTPVIEEKIAELELEFIEEDLRELFSSMHRGAERVAEIVKSLRSFSRLDESQFKEVDIHEGLDATLMVLQNRLKPANCHGQIEVTKEYRKLPLIYCAPQAINQVFMNILNNSIDALRDLDKGRSQEQRENEPSCIWIRTEQLTENSIGIHIKDNGGGIPPHIHNQIFNPFFTTKPVGKGTGLGLSISYQIIDSHGGQIKVQSDEQWGTEFSLELPILPANLPS